MLATDERSALLDTLRRLLRQKSTQADVRRAMAEPAGYDPALWQQLGEMGILGLLVPAEFGGAGAGPIEIELVMEEAGAVLLCAPMLSSTVLAVSALMASGDHAAQSRLLPAIATGARIATLAFTGARGLWTPQAVQVTAQLHAQRWSLSGLADYVTHGHVADTLLVVANTATGTTLFEVAPSAPGVTLQVLPTFDHTLRLARVAFSAAAAEQVGSVGSGWTTAAAALDVARVALAGEQVGGIRRVLEQTVEYTKTRIQFGRPIGSFQAIKHMAADLLLEAESATSAARHAAATLANGSPEAPAAISLAAFACADAYVAAAATSIQMHGGIAFTWDHPAHLYLRRARAAAQLFGTSNYYRERYVQQLGG
jgi:alkylation response protein AidB-like acyl-CoA dehydrogenase